MKSSAENAARGSTKSDRRQAYLMVAPAVAVLVGVAAYPILAAAWLSLHRMILVFHEQRFAGLDNYAFLLHDARFWTALGNTAYFSLVAVALGPEERVDTDCVRSVSVGRLVGVFERVP